MEKAPESLSIDEFKKLLCQLKVEQPDNCIRVRLIGDMWTQNFMRIIAFTHANPQEGKSDFTGVILNDETDNKIRIIRDLTQIIQFEIEKPFKNFEPHFHYTVSPFSKEL